MPISNLFCIDHCNGKFNAYMTSMCAILFEHSINIFVNRFLLFFLILIIIVYHVLETLHWSHHTIVYVKKITFTYRTHSRQGDCILLRIGAIRFTDYGSYAILEDIYLHGNNRRKKKDIPNLRLYKL